MRFHPSISRTFLLMVLLGALFLPQLTLAQSRHLKIADRYFERLDYPNAIRYYQKAVDKHDEDRAVLQLAESYRLIQDYEQAAKWYAAAVGLPGADQNTWFYYGHTLLQQGRYTEAKDAFETFAQKAPGDPRAGSFLAQIDRLDYLMRDSAAYRVENASFNSPMPDFGIFPYRDGFVIASARETADAVNWTFKGQNTPFLDLWFVEKKKNGKWSEPQQLGGDLNTKYHESNFSFDTVGQRAYFSRNAFVNNKKQKSADKKILLEIYTAEMKGAKALNGKDILPFAYNDPNKNLTHPSISPDGQLLFFVSDMEGGEGGKDLYVCQRQGEEWSEPKNLGSAINTPGDEGFPWMDEEGILYFASNGHPGFGNLDIFSVKYPEGEVKNMGWPLNSPFDDFALYVNEDDTSGFLSSNRPGGQGYDDIYEYYVSKQEIRIEVVDSVAQLPLENVRLWVLNEKGDTLREGLSDSLGRAQFRLNTEQNFRLAVVSTEFDPHEAVLSTKMGEDGQRTHDYRVALYNPPPAITAVVVDDSSRQRIIGAEVWLIRFPSTDTLFRKTDRNGRFAVKLTRNTSYEMQVRHPDYLTYIGAVSTKMYDFDGDTIIPLKLRPVEVGKPVVLQNINYDFDKWDLRPDAIPELVKLGKLMKDNPQLKVELSSHTDSRGSDEYNLELSEKRAQSAVNFLLDFGIDKDRITAKGYGEQQLLNSCANGVNCSEDEHFKNRRTEFKVTEIVK